MILVLTLLFILFPLTVHALEFTGTGLTGNVTYIEPSTNNDGAPLMDLDRTEIVINNGIDSPGPWLLVPATSKTGGGVIVQEITIPIPSGQIDTLATIAVRACDDALARGANATDNCSPYTTITKPIDSLPPAGLQ